MNTNPAKHESAIMLFYGNTNAYKQQEHINKSGADGALEGVCFGTAAEAGVRRDEFRESNEITVG